VKSTFSYNRAFEKEKTTGGGSCGRNSLMKKSNIHPVDSMILITICFKDPFYNPPAQWEVYKKGDGYKSSECNQLTIHFIPRIHINNCIKYHVNNDRNKQRGYSIGQFIKKFHSINPNSPMDL
jgi:hypothetical protein